MRPVGWRLRSLQSLRNAKNIFFCNSRILREDFLIGVTHLNARFRGSISGRTRGCSLGFGHEVTSRLSEYIHAPNRKDRYKNSERNHCWPRERRLHAWEYTA